jgi:dihydroorotase
MVKTTTLKYEFHMNQLSSITLTRPDDWHLHIRDDKIMQFVLPHTAKQFGRAIIMPNLKPPVTTTEQALAYRKRIVEALPQECGFEPLMTLYLTDNTSADEIHKARESGLVHAVKLYPSGATTNSDFGVTDIKKTYNTLSVMADRGIPLLIHGEVTDPDIDVFDREKIFIERHLVPLMNEITELKIVLEHITTKDAADFIIEARKNVAATITPHHLLMNRNAIFQGGIRPHHYCLPILKRETHRQALVTAAISGNPRFFLGTDSAPHTKSAKESSCGCAGMYSAHAAIELYAEVFDQANALDKLEAFASFYGPDFYGLPRNQDSITLKRESWEVPAEYSLPGGEALVPLRAGEKIDWKLVD